MGLPMANLHEPTIAAGSSSGVANNDNDDNEASLQELMSKKDSLEAELSALGSVLDSHGVNMRTGLTTLDGFPRADIDVAQIRTTRAQIIRLRNDHKALMSRIEKGLHAHHAATATNAQARQSQTRSNGSPNASISSPGSDAIAFAKVNSVVDDSPAYVAGLRAEDKILRFGDADWLNNEKLSKVAQIVSQNEGRSITVLISRHSDQSATANQLEVQLVPRRNWGGRGLLGCHLVPI